MPKAVNLNKVFDRVGYQPHQGQVKAHDALRAARMRVVCAGRRTGKSTMGGHELTGRAYEAFFRQNELDPQQKRMEYWIVGPEYTDAEKEFRVLWGDLLRLGMPMDKPGSYNDPIGGNMHVSLWGGRFLVHAKSAKYPDSLVGEALSGVILAEAAKLKQSVWTKYLRPTLADYRGWALMTSTPEGKNWFYEAWQRGQQGDEGWWSVRMPSWTNDIIFPGGPEDPEILDMRKDLGEEKYKQEVAAEFTEFVGRVFKDFDEEVHCMPLSYNPDWETYAAVDYGWENPFVWLVVQVDPWGNTYVIDEYYKSHMRIDEIPEELVDLGLVPGNLRYFYPDPASPGDTKVLESKLKIRARGGTGGEIQERLRLIRNHLAVSPHLKHLPEGHPERKPRLFIDSKRCPNTVREFNDYRYPENAREEKANNSENPMKKDDHTPEALGRFFKGYFAPKEKIAKSRTRRSNISN